MFNSFMLVEVLAARAFPRIPAALIKTAQDHDAPYSCADGAGALVIVTEWEQFRALDLDRLKCEMAGPVVVDLRNIYNPDDLTSRGFLYQSIGRAGKPKT
jgi:UDP-glucose 6-dehydrogenase